MTNQEIFNVAYVGVVAQGYQCIDDSGNCVYDDRKGGHCAAGHVLKHAGVDGLFDIEGSIKYTNCSNPRLISALNSVGVKPSQNVLLADIQMAHDYPENDVTFIESYKTSMSKVATKYSLETPV